jgi:predicted metalloprotease with PDZ domain
MRGTPEQSGVSATGGPAGAAICYRVEVDDAHAHLFKVTLSVARPLAQTVLRLPAWIPGSYLIREFTKNLQELRARQGRRFLPTRQIEKATWTIDCDVNKSLELQYRVYAFDNSVRTAWLDADRGFFNGTSLFLQVQGQEQLPHALHLVSTAATAKWQVATALPAARTDRRGFGAYCAENYDALVDCPVEMGSFWSGRFTAGGADHRLVVSGAAHAFDGDRLLADTQAICEAQIRFWHAAEGKAETARSRPKAPFDSYLFLLNAVTDGHGGLEHGTSTALICPRKDLPRRFAINEQAVTERQPDGYSTLLGLISHEYFHTWNVKRLRPAEFRRYDYHRENYTELLWFFEGFTSYYDDLLLRRAQRIDTPAYLKSLCKTINQVRQTPGRLVQSVAQASFDAWVKYYRQDENTANATVSYYTKGSLVALCLDLTLRAEGRGTLDAVMRGLWTRCQGGPMTEADLLAVLALVGDRSYAPEIESWVHRMAELPVTRLLECHGVQVHQDPAPLPQQLGLKINESAGLAIAHVARGSVAEKAGFASGDEWLALETAGGAQRGPWRLQTLDDLRLYAGQGGKITALVARDRRLRTLTLKLPKTGYSVRLAVAQPQLVARWLDAAN